MVGTSFTSLKRRKTILRRRLRRSFDEIQQAAEAQWRESLSSIEVEGGTAEQRSIFYTALYHSMLGPRPVNDVDAHTTALLNPE